MNTRTVERLAALAIAVSVLIPCSEIRATEPPAPAVEGVYGMESVGVGAWLAVRVMVPPDHAVAGIQWFNNDDTTVFDEILVGTGYADSPGPLSEFSVMASAVQGGASALSSVDFDVPVVPSLDALYVAFAFPSGQQLVGSGHGGGPAIGYGDASVGSPGWLSGDGEIWARLHEAYSFVVLPELVPVEPGMLVKSMSDQEDDETPPIEPFMSIGPNPFNPTTEIRFGVDAPARLRLDVFDLRGRRIARLVDGPVDRGVHRVIWDGADRAGRGVASGVYLVRLHGGDIDFKRKITLAR